MSQRGKREKKRKTGEADPRQSEENLEAIELFIFSKNGRGPNGEEDATDALRAARQARFEKRHVVSIGLLIDIDLVPRNPL